MNLGSSGSANSERVQTASGWNGRLVARLRRLIPTRDEARRHRALRWLGPLLEHEWLWNWNRRTVAIGAAMGVFFGLIIPVAQMPFAAAAAIVLRANLPAAALGTLVSNPFTVGPIYWLAYEAGSAIILSAGENLNQSGIDAVGGIAQHGQPRDWLDHIANVGVPLMLGLALFGVGGAVLIYLAVMLAWRLNVHWLRRRRRLTATAMRHAFHDVPCRTRNNTNSLLKFVAISWNSMGHG
jgi:uncharacterized protein